MGEMSQCREIAYDINAKHCDRKSRTKNDTKSQEVFIGTMSQKLKSECRKKYYIKIETGKQYFPVS